MLHEMLYNAILKGMEADHNKTPSGGQEPLGCLQCILKLVKFVADRNAQRLEDAGRRRKAVLMRPTDYPLQQLGKLRSARPGTALAAGDYCLGNRPRIPLLAVFPEDVGKLLLLKGVQDVRGRRVAGGRIIRMSRGASNLKEKPRSGVSICGEETPMSRMTPST